MDRGERPGLGSTRFSLLSHGDSLRLMLPKPLWVTIYPGYACQSVQRPSLLSVTTFRQCCRIDLIHRIGVKPSPGV